MAKTAKPKDAFAKEILLKCKGYQEDFIKKNKKIGLGKILPAPAKKLLPAVEGSTQKILHYTSLSVLYNCKRKVPFVSAYNIDGSSKDANVKRASGFKGDPRISPSVQLNKKFYDLDTKRTEFEIGHMAANNEMAWGTDAQFKSFQTFHFPNSVPQAENLNTGIWKSLESYIIKEAATVKDNKRICVFTGPLLKSNDPFYIKDTSFQIPLVFFKVIVFITPKGLFSTGFMMSHEEQMKKQNMFAPRVRRPGLAEDEEEVTFFDDFKFSEVFQVNITTIEKETGLNFTWSGVQPLAIAADKNKIEKIRKIKDSSDAKKATGRVSLAGDDTADDGAEVEEGLSMILPS